MAIPDPHEHVWLYHPFSNTRRECACGLRQANTAMLFPYYPIRWFDTDAEFGSLPPMPPGDWYALWTEEEHEAATNADPLTAAIQAVAAGLDRKPKRRRGRV